MPGTNPLYKAFETELRVRPDDIDMFQHVHNSKYFDYVLAARYDQMELNYGMSMERFMENGYGWVVKAVHINFKRALMLGDYFTVKTGINEIDDRGCRVKFIITNKSNNKVSADGWFDFVMIDINTGKSVLIPDDIMEHYMI
ncbi:acyl-CoA thioesterase [Mucilaginibacter sp. HMF5004]|uniref:acyl-CoA thioesterase n=1 Tax=Mucilaginibacter rivuli TaxID=2857527 RepID=UPI001C5FF7F4|nr:acyl-CoA thioesterase [Mucilaginibacter rivuli]MBW4891526.1 acyl-CoA thioesterase [Mucilaginibacter rivuli]